MSLFPRHLSSPCLTSLSQTDTTLHLAMYRLLLLISIHVLLLCRCHGDEVHVLLPTSTNLWSITGRGRQVWWRVGDGAEQTECCQAWDLHISGESEGSAPVYIARNSRDFLSVSPDRTVLKAEVILPDYIESGSYTVTVSCVENRCDTTTDTGTSPMFTIYNHGASADEVQSQYESRLYEEYERWRERNLQMTKNLRRDGGCEGLKVLVQPSRDQFYRECVVPGSPCALKNITDAWPARRRWQLDELSSDPRLTEGVRVGNVEQYFPLRRYRAWLKSHAQESRIQPMVFMPEVYELYPPLLDDFSLPDYFTPDQDLMTPVSDLYRMDWRWMIIAPHRSGSNHHVDPVNTSAWLSLPVGRKRWGFYPPHSSYIPGVKSFNYKKNDYTSIDSYTWWSHTYPYLQEAFKPMQCVQETGDTFYIPGGWWHNVLNLEDTVAVTQNLVTPHILTQVVGELASQGDAAPDNFLPYTLSSLRSLYSHTYPHHFPPSHSHHHPPPEGAPTLDEYVRMRTEDLYAALEPL